MSALIRLFVQWKVGLIIGGILAILGFALFMGVSRGPIPLLAQHLSENLDPGELENVQSLYLSRRKKGKNIQWTKVYGNNWKNLIGQAWVETKTNEDFDQVVLCFGKKINSDIKNFKFHRGATGILLKWDGDKAHFCSTESVIRNRKLGKWIRLTQKEFKLDKNKISYALFPTNEYLWDKSTGEVKKLLRGNEVVLQSEVNQSNVQRLAENMAHWLFSNLNKNGQMTYKYWPSSGNYSDSNNMIRQFMATLALIRWSDFKNSSELRKKSLKNLNYNLESFYKEEKLIGFIEFRKKRKLGAAALAALSIYESSDFNSRKTVFQKILKAIDRQWQQSGEMRTFIGQERNDLHNFYPGEALYFWSFLLLKEKDEKRIQKFLKSFSYYKKWHLENRNPAFVPWHTQAYYNLYQIKPSKKLKDWIFEMNDWLIENMQTAEDNMGHVYPDTVGRFYHPSGKYGPPHASSTGVYLEGLIDAYQLAKDTGDRIRQQKYRVSILKGLRHALQLEFRDDVDTFYITKKKRVLGGLRTTVFNNTIRVDNVQHNLLAIIKILKQFEAKDYIFDSGDP